jgi:hypothetical protein
MNGFLGGERQPETGNRDAYQVIGGKGARVGTEQIA